MIKIFNRQTKKIEEEQVYKEKWLVFLYSKYFISKILLPLITKTPFFSKLYGYFQKTKRSKKKIGPFVKNFNINTDEFEKKVDEFDSFNDFFIRKLKNEVRPINGDSYIAAFPADGRYLVFPDISKTDGFYVKGQKFSLEKLLNDNKLQKQYQNGSMVIARLNPTDYHRFHFPCLCEAGETTLINGSLLSVNPIVLTKNINVLFENKRMITALRTKEFGSILYLEIGATNVGSIHQTYSVGKTYKKGEEKGFFSFGGSSVILLFEKNKITFDDDLIKYSEKKIETKALFGQRLGKSNSF